MQAVELWTDGAVTAEVESKKLQVRGVEIEPRVWHLFTEVST